jgi:hypothetical protein
MLVSSAPNPSLPGTNVTITATVNANVPSTNTPTGTVTFKTNTVPLGPSVPLVNGVAVMATTGLPHDFTPVWAEYPGDGQFLGSTGSVKWPVAMHRLRRDEHREILPYGDPNQSPGFPPVRRRALEPGHLWRWAATNPAHARKPNPPILGVTRIRPQPDGSFTICSFFDVFTELSLNSGLTWSPATNGSIPLVLVGGAPPNGFPTNSLPPPAGQYVTPPGWPEFYPQQGGPIIAIQNITLRSFTMTFPPPPPGMSSTYNFSALADLFVSWDGGHTWMPFTAPAQVQMLIKGRPSGP